MTEEATVVETAVETAVETEATMVANSFPLLKRAARVTKSK